MSQHVNGTGAPESHLNEQNILVPILEAAGTANESKFKGEPLWCDPALVAGLAIQFGRIGGTNGTEFPEGIRCLLVHHTSEGSLACEIVLAWLFQKGLISVLSPATAEIWEGAGD